MLPITVYQLVSFTIYILLHYIAAFPYCYLYTTVTNLTSYHLTDMTSLKYDIYCTIVVYVTLP